MGTDRFVAERLCACAAPQLVVSINCRKYHAEPDGTRESNPGGGSAECQVCGGEYAAPWRFTAAGPGGGRTRPGSTTALFTGELADLATGRVGHLGGPAAGQLDHDAACQTVFLSVYPSSCGRPRSIRSAPQPRGRPALPTMPASFDSTFGRGPRHSPGRRAVNEPQERPGRHEGVDWRAAPGAAPLPYSWPGRCSVPPQGEGDGI